jgi:DNA-directed RNA polymerase specialized sigma24 family protein
MGYSSLQGVVDRGRDRLHNWAAWSRLDGADIGYPRKTSYWTPPRTGDTYDEEESLPENIDHQDAERVNDLIQAMSYTPRFIVKMIWFERKKKSELARHLGCTLDKAINLLTEVESEIGRAR